jgi:hypothetical protein
MSNENKLSPWEKYKKNLGATRPWDMINPNVDRISEDIAQEKLSICQSCPELIKLTSQCKKCGCFMPAKTKLLNAQCPIGKW